MTTLFILNEKRGEFYFLPKKLFLKILGTRCPTGMNCVGHGGLSPLHVNDDNVMYLNILFTIRFRTVFNPKQKPSKELPKSTDILTAYSQSVT